MNYTHEYTEQKRQQDIKNYCEQIITNNIDICKSSENVVKVAHAFLSQPNDYKDYFLQIAQITGFSESSALKTWNKCEKKNNHKSSIKSFFYLCEIAGLDINTKTEQSTEKTKASKLGTLWDKNARLVLWIVFEKPFEHPYIEKETGQCIKNDRHTFYSKKLTELEPSAKEAINFFFEKIERLHQISPIKKAYIYFNLNRGNNIKDAQNIEICRYNPKIYGQKDKAILTAESLPYLHIHKYLSLKEIDEYVFSLQELEQKMLIPRGQAQKTKEYILNHYQQYTPNSQKFHAQRAEKQHENNIFSIPTSANLSPISDTQPQENIYENYKTEFVPKKTFKEQIKEIPKINATFIPLAAEQKIKNFTNQINSLSDSEFLEWYNHNNRQEEINKYADSLQNQ